MGNFENETSYSSHYHDWIYFRYAEILLNYAEASNEFAGPSDSVFNAVEAIRQRCRIKSLYSRSQYFAGFITNHYPE